MPPAAQPISVRVPAHGPVYKVIPILVSEPAMLVTVTRPKTVVVILNQTSLGADPAVQVGEASGERVTPLKFVASCVLKVAGTHIGLPMPKAIAPQG